MKQWYALYSNILYMHFSSGFYTLPDSAKNAASPHNPAMRLFRMAGYTAVRLIGNLFKSVERQEELQGKVWLYVVSQNNYDSLKFISESLPDTVFVAGQSKAIGRYNRVVQRLSLRRKLFYYYKFPFLLIRFLKTHKKSTSRFFDLLYDAIGFYEVYLRKLRFYKPLAIVFANDHNADARAMLLAAKTLGVKTIYIQHASVSPIFPPLAFDLNLLEGQDALAKYKACGPIQGQVQLIGMPKADTYIPQRNRSKYIKTVGIGCNLLDDPQEVEQLLRKLSVALPEITFILRPHPRDTRDLAAFVTIAGNIKLSDSHTEPVFDYLQQLDVQVSGTSGIHLEAVLLNVWSIFYNFKAKQQLKDYYGFVEHGLVDVVDSPDELLMLLNRHLHNRPQVVERARYYNATVGTANEGKSSEIAIQHIKTFLHIKNKI